MKKVKKILVQIPGARMLLLALVVLAATATIVHSQQPTDILWQKCFGGTQPDEGSSFIQTIEGGFVGVGETSSNDGDVWENKYNSGDLWVIKLNSSGILQWQKCIGGSWSDVGTSIIQTTDGGFAITGWTASNDGDVSGNHGSIYSSDTWVVKLDTAGVIEWQKCLGGSNSDRGTTIIQTADGGYAVAGMTASTDGDVSGNHGSDDAWIVKLSSGGSIQWQKCIGGSGLDQVFSLIQTSDGGFATCGFTISLDGDLAGLRPYGNNYTGDAWVVKLTDSGSIQWQKCYGGSRDDNAMSIIQTTDGGYAFAGGTTSTDGDVSGLHITTKDSAADAWIVKLDSVGSIQWQKCVGGTRNDNANAIIQAKDGDFIIAAHTESNNGDVSGFHDTVSPYIADGWIVKLNRGEGIQWQRCLGGSGTDWTYSIIQTKDGALVVGGYTSSTDGDVSGNHGIDDYWLVKLQGYLSAQSLPSFTLGNFRLNVYPNPASKNLAIGFDLPKISSDVVITITNIIGERLQEIHPREIRQGHNEISLDISSLEESTYFVTVFASGLSQTTSIKVVR
jgi:hypothetical protein